MESTGQTSRKLHFEMEKAGKSSRWNTLRGLRTIKHFEEDVDFPNEYKVKLV